MFGIGILIYMHFQNHNLLTNPLKKLLIIALLIVGCEEEVQLLATDVDEFVL